MATVAIPIFRSRVAPVFDSCLRVLLVYLERDRETERTGLPLHGLSPAERVGALARAGVTTLICGGISDALCTMFEKSGVCVVCGVAGPVEKVLTAFMSDQLDEPQFHMPGHMDKQGGDETRPQKRGTQELN
ncbi:MAG: hypothetical protein HWN69_06105 [Desulfobacterales bacterium]|nr:hypothetical protein [Desulfobacterales bacterium]